MFFNSDFLFDDKDFMESLNKNIVPRLKYAIKNEEHFPIAKNKIRKKFEKTFRERCSKESLDKCINKFNSKQNKGWAIGKRGVNVAISYSNAEGDSYQFQLCDLTQRIETEPELLLEHFKKHFDLVIKRNNLYWYKPGCYMGWHHNARNDIDTDRIYLVWCDKDNKSFFRYRNPETGEIITKWEKKGWNFNYFRLSKVENPSWHCLYSDCNRFSIGYRLEKRK